MKRFFIGVYELLNHIAFAMTMGLAILCYLEGRNPLMRFLTSNYSRIYIWTLCGILCVIFIVNLARFSRRGR